MKMLCKYSILFCGMIFLILSACSESSVEPPSIKEVNAESNSNNTLSAVVKASVNNAAEAYIKFSQDNSFSQRSPLFPVVDNKVQIPLLGLLENETYSVRVVAVSSSGDEVESDTLTYTSGALPEDIPSLTVLTNQSPSEGFVMVNLSRPDPTLKGYAVIINNEGQVVWYREFINAVNDFQKQSNGNYTIYASDDGSPLHFYEVNNLGEILGEFKARDGFATGPHEIKLLDGGGYCLFAIDFREMDLRAFGGLSVALVRGTGIECIRPNQEAFYWSPFDHFSVGDTDPDTLFIPVKEPYVNPWHGNGFDIDTDGNLLVSFRNTSEITKIDSQTGDIIWRLGGKNNEFTFLNDSLGGFSHQHEVKRLENGNIILFDNGNLHSPRVSRPVEYKLDEKNKVAEFVWEYRNDPPIFGGAAGYTQRLSNGSTLIHYGSAGKIIEVDNSGVKQWEIEVPRSHISYRSFRIDSIY